MNASSIHLKAPGFARFEVASRPLQTKYRLHRVTGGNTRFTLRSSQQLRSTTRCSAENGHQADGPADYSTDTNHKEGWHKRADDALPLSLYIRYDNLPCDGRTQTEEQETCDPKQQSCQRSMHVWESKCRACAGRGVVTSYSRRGGRRSSYTCPSCHGIGAVRKTSARIIPDVNNGNGQFTVNRPPCTIHYSDDEKKKSLFERFKEKIGGD